MPAGVPCLVWEVSEPGESLLAALFPHLAGLRVHRVEDRGDAVVICASSRAGQACCPRCGSASSRVHGGYTPMLADGAAGGRPVLIALRARRFRCREPSCAVVTFAELAAVEADDQAGLRSLAAGIRTDLQAVTNGLTLPWSSGRVEGTVNKIKMIKRQMYGRAGFDLLRKRVILHPA